MRLTSKWRLSRENLQVGGNIFQPVNRDCGNLGSDLNLAELISPVHNSVRTFEQR